ncbi:hypothetical protein HNP77_001955 [Treponema rectale]|uniref:Listeria/Bacterioides repeat-containing protein n=1 Tax=Treponema rectale TaxID=744512 RepID=A0A840SJA7_9SPIR|nr:leucine-rich repeat protein [Treponema rectale]MBB5219573.1 hypothetical protein [Treponema rectale]
MKHLKKAVNFFLLFLTAVFISFFVSCSSDGDGKGSYEPSPEGEYKCRVTFYPDDGSEYFEQEVVQGDYVVEPEYVPHKAGYVFLGWAEWDMEKNCVSDTLFDFKNTPATDFFLILYAKWRVKDGTYRITFDYNGGTKYDETSKVVSVKEDYALQYLPDEPVKNYYSFGGWFLNLGEENECEFTLETVITDDITVKAKWIVKEYVLEFLSDGTENAEKEDIIFTVEKPVIIPECTFEVPDNHYFAGWSTSDSGTRSSIGFGAGKEVKELSDLDYWENYDCTLIKIYAVFLPYVSHNIIYNDIPSDSAAPSRTSFFENEDVELEPIERYGYIFIGWSGGIEGWKAYEQTEDIVLSPIWKLKSEYEVTVEDAFDVIEKLPECNIYTIKISGEITEDFLTEFSKAVVDSSKVSELNLDLRKATGLTVMDPSISDNVMLQNNKKLGSLVLPDVLEELGGFALYNCSNFNSITVPENYRGNFISALKFSSSRVLSNIIVDEKNTRYATVDGVLYSKDLKIIYLWPAAKAKLEIEIPEGVEEIDSYAFWKCVDLYEVIIPSSVKKICSDAFGDCHNLCKVTFKDPYSWFETENFSYDYYNQWKSSDCLTKEELEKADNYHAKSDLDLSFRFHNKYLYKHQIDVTAENALSEITKDKLVATVTIKVRGRITTDFLNDLTALIRDFNLSSVKINLDLSAITGITELEAVSGKSLFAGWDITDVVLPAGIKTISKNAFYQCWRLERVVIPSELESIGEFAFLECRLLKNIEIPDSVKVIEQGAFKETGLTSFNLPASLETFSGSALNYMDNLESVSISSSAKNFIVKNNAVYSEDEKTLVAYPVTGTEFTIPNGTQIIGEYAFTDSKITSIVIPSTVKTIGHAAFSECESLTKILIPASVTEIGDWAFSSSGLTEISFEDPENWYKQMNFGSGSGDGTLSGWQNFGDVSPEDIVKAEKWDQSGLDGLKPYRLRKHGVEY